MFVCFFFYIFFIIVAAEKNGVKLLLDWTGFEVLKMTCINNYFIIIIIATVNANFRMFIRLMDEVLAVLLEFQELNVWMVHIIIKI